MSKLTELAALRMQLFVLERQKCAQCGHTLGAHEPRQSAPTCACHAPLLKPHASRDPERARIVSCKCKAFVDEVTEQMELT